MISIIICSINKTLSNEFIANIRNTIGVESEIINIDNSKNQYSIFEAYNLGFQKSKFPCLCFVHDDIKFHTLDWGKKIIEHLQDVQTGIIGLAGGNLNSRIPLPWPTQRLAENIIQSDKTGRKPTETNIFPENVIDSRQEVIVLDGVFLCMRKELLSKIKFDENLTGFHGYDYDISIQSVVAGFRNYVIYDIEAEHFSRGKTSYSYYKNGIAVFKKWENRIPINLFSNEGEIVSPSLKSEEKRLKKLIKKMIVNGFSLEEIRQESTYFANRIESEKWKKKLKAIRFYIFSVKLFNRPSLIIKKYPV